jgi:hypothetical protein
VRTSVLRRTAAAVLLSAVAFGLAACDNLQVPATNYPTQSYGNPPSTATTTSAEQPTTGASTTTGSATSGAPGTGDSGLPSVPAGAETTTP